MIPSSLRIWRPPPWLISRLPGTSRTFGPPRKMLPARALPSGVRSVSQTITVAFAQPCPLNDVDPWWSSPPSLLPPVSPYVLESRSARLLSAAGWVVVERDTFVYDTAFWGHPDLLSARRWHDIFLRKKPRPGPPLSGRVLSLASDFAPYSYGHWLIDSLPRWLLAERAGLTHRDFDHIYIPCPDTPSTRTLLAKLGLPPEKIIRTPAPGDTTVEHLVATSFPGAAGSASNLARTLALRLHPPRRAQRLLYLSREGHRRNLVNSPELHAVFNEFGFEICFPATDPDTVAKCAGARVIVGIEGSQCFNALFAPPGGALVVIAPSGFHPLPYMQSIAGAAGLGLFLLGARSDADDGSCFLAPDDLRAGLRRVLDLHP